MKSICPPDRTLSEKEHMRKYCQMSERKRMYSDAMVYLALGGQEYARTSGDIIEAQRRFWEALDLLRKGFSAVDHSTEG